MSSTALRGADMSCGRCERAGHTTIFTLSGNHIMSMFDAAIDAGPAWCMRDTRPPRCTWPMPSAASPVSRHRHGDGGPGHANAAGALITALGQESPMVLLSGHTETTQFGRGGFRKSPGRSGRADGQSLMDRNGYRNARPRHREAIRIAPPAGRGRCISACRPICLMRSSIRYYCVARPNAFTTAPVALNDAPADAILEHDRERAATDPARRPAFVESTGRDLLARFEPATQVPTAIVESPRGFTDATLGAFADAMRRADMIILLGKALDFTLKFGDARRSSRLPADRHRSRRTLVDRAIRERAIACVRLRRRHAPRRRGDRSATPGQRDRRGWPRSARCSPIGPRRGRRSPRRHRQAASDRSVPSAAALRGTRSRHSADLRRRRIRAMGPGVLPVSHADDQWRRRLDRSSLPMARRRVIEPKARCSWCSATARSASTWPNSRPPSAANCRSSPSSAMTRAGMPKTSSSSATTARTVCSAANCYPPATTKSWPRSAAMANGATP